MEEILKTIDIDSLISFIPAQGVIMIPVIYVLGIILKKVEVVKDKHILLSLLLTSIVLTPAIIGEYNAKNVAISVLVVGVCVLTNQLPKQAKKVE